MGNAAVSQPLPAAVPQPESPSRPRLLSESLVLLSVAHLTVDLFSSAVPALQPVLTAAFSLSLTQAGALAGVFMFASSVLQLPFGLLADRLHTRIFTVLGPTVAALFLSSLGLAPRYAFLLALVFLGGMGVAMFHPPSTSRVAHMAGPRRGLAVAVFITAGTFGLALGPPYFTAITERMGFERLWVAMLPALLISAVLWWRLPERAEGMHAAPRKPDWQALRAQGRLLGLHYTLVVLRSVVQLGVGQFLTLYLVQERGYSLRQAGLALALYFLSASAGAFLGGNLADRLGGKKVIVASMAGASPFLALFLATGGWLSLAGLFLSGLLLLLTIPVNVVMAQDLVPSQASTVSALMMGFAWGIAGITFIPLMGWIADHTSLHAVLWALVALPLIGLALSLRLPAKAPRAIH